MTIDFFCMAIGTSPWTETKNVFLEIYINKSSTYTKSIWHYIHKHCITCLTSKFWTGVKNIYYKTNFYIKLWNVALKKTMQKYLIYLSTSLLHVIEKKIQVLCGFFVGLISSNNTLYQFLRFHTPCTVM